MRRAALALAIACPASAFAGGYGGAVAAPECAVISARGQLSLGATCVQDGQLVVVSERRVGLFHGLLRDRPRVEYVNGRRCPYPNRPSDSPFAGGAGYVIKNDVRAIIGCAF